MGLKRALTLHFAKEILEIGYVLLLVSLVTASMRDTTRRICTRLWVSKFCKLRPNYKLSPKWRGPHPLNAPGISCNYIQIPTSIIMSIRTNVKGLYLVGRYGFGINWFVPSAHPCETGTIQQERWTAIKIFQLLDVVPRQQDELAPVPPWIKN